MSIVPATQAVSLWEAHAIKPLAQFGIFANLVRKYVDILVHCHKKPICGVWNQVVSSRNTHRVLGRGSADQFRDLLHTRIETCIGYIAVSFGTFNQMPKFIHWYMWLTLLKVHLDFISHCAKCNFSKVAHSYGTFGKSLTGVAHAMCSDRRVHGCARNYLNACSESACKR